MKLKNNVMVALVLACLAVIGLTAFIDFRITYGLLAVLFVLANAFVIIRAKKIDLTIILGIIGSAFWIISLLLITFWVHDFPDLNNWSRLFQALGMFFCGIASILNRGKERKATEKFKSEFATYFKGWDITLPKETVTKRKTGTINKAGWLIKFGFGRDGDAEFLEVYAVHPNTNHRHFKVMSSGESKQLPTLDNLQEAKEEKLIADLKQKGLFDPSFNSWLVSYISYYQHSKSRYEIDKYLIDVGYNPGEIEGTWDSLTPKPR